VYTNFASETDPAADDYSFYLNTPGTILERYKNYNGVEGNSIVDITNANRDRQRFLMLRISTENTMNTINAYYEYSIDVKPNLLLGRII
jgi:cell surface protein SprA